ncbi:hypothetical protein GTGU_01791 [Trabulsiella guamensis ATCC 49490]|uniref:Uncharacterized protein n=2 Tax=Trabulsiella guamensis TaxID=158852 RepID=A0A085AB16_9ENTR|nr:hypothetical protein GTGU_01791 [Trabulsiella guamensis ATCC 49490]
MEDHPHKLSESEVSALASLLKKLAGDVFVYMSEVSHQLENSK